MASPSYATGLTRKLFRCAVSRSSDPAQADASQDNRFVMPWISLLRIRDPKAHIPRPTVKNLAAMAYGAPLAESPRRPGHRTFAEPSWGQRKAGMPLCFSPHQKTSDHSHQVRKEINISTSKCQRKQAMHGNIYIYMYIAMLLKPPGAPLIVDSYKEVLHATALLLILQGSCQGCEHVLSPFQRALKLKEQPLLNLTVSSAKTKIKIWHEFMSFAVFFHFLE